MDERCDTFLGATIRSGCQFNRFVGDLIDLYAVSRSYAGIVTFIGKYLPHKKLLPKRYYGYHSFI